MKGCYGLGWRWSQIDKFMRAKTASLGVIMLVFATIVVAAEDSGLRIFLPYLQFADPSHPPESTLRIYDSVDGASSDELRIGEGLGPIDDCGQGSRVAVAAKQQRSISLLSTEAPYAAIEAMTLSISPDLIAASPDCRRLWIGSLVSNSIYVAAFGRQEYVEFLTVNHLSWLAPSSSGRHVLIDALVSEDREILAYDALTGAQIFEYRPRPGLTLDNFELDLTSDGLLLYMESRVSGGASNFTQLERIDVRTGTITATYQFPSLFNLGGVRSGPDVYKLELSEDQSVLQVGTDTGIHVFDATSLEELDQFPASGNVFDFNNGVGAFTYRRVRVGTQRSRTLSIIDLSDGEILANHKLMPPGGSTAVGDFLVFPRPESRPMGVPLNSIPGAWLLIIVVGLIGYRAIRKLEVGGMR